MRESGGGPLPTSGAERSRWCSLHKIHLHDNADCRVQQQQRGNGGGGGYTRGTNNSGNGNRRRHGGGSNTGRANTAVTANGISSPTVVTPVPAAPITALFTPVAAPPAPFTALPTPIRSEAAPTPYINESPPSGIAFLFLAGFVTSGPLKFTMTSDCGASSHFVDGYLIGDIASPMKDIVKLNPPVKIAIADRSTLREVDVGTLTVRVTETERLLHEMLLPTMNVPGLSRYLFSERTAVFKK